MIINELDYHKNFFSQELNNFSLKIQKKLFLVYPKLKDIILESFNRYTNKYTLKEQEDVIKRMIISTTKEIIDDGKDMDEQQYLSKLKKTILKALPIILVNEKNYNVNSFLYYEPRIVYSYYLLNRGHEIISELYEENKENSNDSRYVILLMNNIIRALKSSIVLYTSKDDVHAKSIERGLIEQFIRFNILNDDNYEDFVKYIDLNAELQVLKMENKDLSDSPRIKDFVAKNKIKPSQLENYLLNGWAKDEEGKPLLTIGQMIDYFDDSKLKKEYHFDSEFVHEDYINVPYDYIQIRKNGKNFIEEVTLTIFNHLDKTVDILDSKDRKILMYLNDSYK